MMTNGRDISSALFSRRGILAGLAALPIFPYLWPRRARRTPTFSLDGANGSIGHLLRSRGHLSLPLSEEITKKKVAIIGGGVSGLGAARRLQQGGMTDVILLELETQLGGNAGAQANKISGFPLGAHYLPIPSKESVHVQELLEEFGLILERDAEGKPLYDERHLLHAPQSRLHRFGRWQEGILPTIGISADDQAQYERFLAEMERFSEATGSDGKRAFVIPLDESSRDSQFTQLDSISMERYLDREGYSSETLRWYIDYCCRDDFGTPLAAVSAWAGIHYFAARVPYAANDSDAELFTWPEGNGWLVEQMRQRLSADVRSGSMVTSIIESEGEYEIEVLKISEMTRYRVRAAEVIFAAPRFLYRYLAPQLARQQPNFEYTPWLVANISIHDAQEIIGRMPWDSVSFHSRSLGCVLSTHQALAPLRDQAVLTWYRPLDDSEPKAAREAYVSRSAESLGQEVLDDLFVYYPKLKGKVGNVQLWLWAHAMIRPTPGFIWGAEREAAKIDDGRVVFAHSDMSGISIFEEALYRGNRAADLVLERLRAV